MKIVISGCGKIGSAIVAGLVSEGHDIVVIDRSAEVISAITDIYDVMGVCGSGADSDILKEADVSGTDLFVAAADSDELNMLSCFLAGRMGAKNTIARIRNPEYNDDSLSFMREQLELSVALNPEQLVAQEIFNILKFPAAVKVERFSRRHLEMIEMKLKPDSVLDGLKLSELRMKYKAKILICCVQREDSVFIPDGNFVLHGGDKIGITAAPAEMQRFLRSLGVLQKQARSVMILGGSRIAYYLTGMLTGIGINVRIIERDEKTAAEFCQHFPKAVVIQGDGAQQEILLEEGLRQVDAFVSLTGMDEENILISIFAASQKVPTVISKINREEQASLAEKLGLECVVSPQKITVDVLLQHARAMHNSLGSNVETLYMIMDGQAEALEFNVKSDPRIDNIPLRSLHFRKNTLIAGIMRERSTFIPAGDDVILPGDRVVVITSNKHYSDFTDILA